MNAPKTMSNRRISFEHTLVSHYIFCHIRTFELNKNSNITSGYRKFISMVKYRDFCNFRSIGKA